MKKSMGEAVVRETGRIKILMATLLALVVAVLVLATLILPAEFNIDPLGSGKVLGIMGLSETTPEIETISKEKTKHREDTISFQLLPFEFVEYKYQLSQGSTVLYSWAASDTVSYDFHGEPEDGPEGFAESFSLGQGDHENGAFIAPFNGIHGWYWANHGTDTVTVKLRTAGFYTASLEFRDGFVTKKELLSEDP